MAIVGYLSSLLHLWFESSIDRERERKRKKAPCLISEHKKGRLKSLIIIVFVHEFRVIIIPSYSCINRTLDCMMILLPKKTKILFDFTKPPPSLLCTFPLYFSVLYRWWKTNLFRINQIRICRHEFSCHVPPSMHFLCSIYSYSLWGHA